MADKSLTESDWKSFAKSNKLDDPKEASKDTKALHEAVQEALQELGKKDENKHDEMLAALGKFEGLITKQIAANAKRKDKDGKAIKDTKEVKDQLYKMLTAVEKQRKEIAAAKDHKESKDRKDSKVEAEDDEEADSPALLTTKMTPLIRAVRKGDLVLQALIAVAGKETVVLVSRKAISPARGKLLKEQMANPGGLKFIRGECIFEENALTFVVQASAGGLAKRIKAALYAQLELRLKVRVRGEDPDDLDEEGEDEAPAAGTAAGAADAAAASTAAAAAAAAGTPADAATQANRPAPPDAAKLAFAKRMMPLKVEVDKLAVRGDAQAAQLQALLDAARQKVKDGDVQAGNDGLTTVEKLLAGVATSAGTSASSGPASGSDAPMARGTAQAPPVSPALAFRARLTEMLPRMKPAEAAGGPVAAQIKAKRDAAVELARQKGVTPAQMAEAMALLDEIETLCGGGQKAAAPGAPDAGRSFVDYAKARLAWVGARKQVGAELDKLERAILEAYKDTPEFAQAKAATRKLDVILRSLDEALADKLDEGLNAADPQARAAINKQAAAIIARYQSFAASSPLVRDIDNNPFVPVNVQDLVITTLDDLERQLA